MTLTNEGDSRQSFVWTGSTWEPIVPSAREGGGLFSKLLRRTVAAFSDVPELPDVTAPRLASLASPTVADLMRLSLPAEEHRAA